MRSIPELGTKQAIEVAVGTHHLAGSIDVFRSIHPPVPNILATIHMIAFMEKAAALVLAPFLEPEETSVGIAIDVTHDAGTCEGDTVRAEAFLRVIEGAKFVFEVIAYDSGGPIGRGSHRRAVVKRAQVEAAARARPRSLA